MDTPKITEYLNKIKKEVYVKDEVEMLNELGEEGKGLTKDALISFYEAIRFKESIKETLPDVLDILRDYQFYGFGDTEEESASKEKHNTELQEKIKGLVRDRGFFADDIRFFDMALKEMIEATVTSINTELNRTKRDLFNILVGDEVTEPTIKEMEDKLEKLKEGIKELAKKK